VPFKGGGPAMIDVVGGHTKVMFSSLVQTTPHIKTGKLRALGVGGKERNKVLPDVPTVAEAGLPDFSAVIHYGLVAPAGTPRGVIDRLNKELVATLAADDLRARLAAEGATALAGTPEDYAAVIDREETRWGALVRELNLKIE